METYFFMNRRMITYISVLLKFKNYKITFIHEDLVCFTVTEINLQRKETNSLYFLYQTLIFRNTFNCFHWWLLCWRVAINVSQIQNSIQITFDRFAFLDHKISFGFSCKNKNACTPMISVLKHFVYRFSNLKIIYSSFEGRLKIPFLYFYFWNATNYPFLSKGQIAENLNIWMILLIFKLMPYNISASSSGYELKFRVKVNGMNVFMNIKEVTILLGLDYCIDFIVKKGSIEDDEGFTIKRNINNWLRSLR